MKFELAILISLPCLCLAFTNSIVYGSVNTLNPTMETGSTLDTSSWKNYSDPVYGLKISYPADWEPMEWNGGLFFCPINDTDCANFGYFGIYVNDLDKNETIQEILRDKIISSKSSDSVENIVTTQPNKTKLTSGIELYQYQSTHTYSSGESGKGFDAIAISGGLKYDLGYAAGADEFDRYFPIVKTMIYSFEPITFEFPESPAQ